jgi:hypothetical protein
MSWWDYGYQITGMANRTVLVDNNTWNNTHIATVGKAFASTEEEGYKIAKFMGANYMLVIFGGMTNFSGDDIAKFLWIVRIAGKSIGRLLQTCSRRVPDDKGRQFLQQRQLQDRQVRLRDYAQLPHVQTCVLQVGRDQVKREGRQGLRHSPQSSDRQ